MSQYKEFAQVYDRLINEDIDHVKWSKVIDHICSRMGIGRTDYLDLGCGTGNLTEHVAQYFKNTLAVDLSPEMLTEAELKNRSHGKKIKYVCQNICELQLNRKFDLITCCLDATNYILSYEELDSYFHGVYTHLNDNGIFIFDINSYYKLTNILGNNTFNYEDEDVVYIWENQLEDEIVDMYLTFFIREGEFYRRFDEEHSERAYTVKDIQCLLKKNSLEIIEMLDNYDDKKITDTSERITFVVKKTLQHSK